MEFLLNKNQCKHHDVALWFGHCWPTDAVTFLYKRPLFLELIIVFVCLVFYVLINNSALTFWQFLVSSQDGQTGCISSVPLSGWGTLSLEGLWLPPLTSCSAGLLHCCHPHSGAFLPHFAENLSLCLALEAPFLTSNVLLSWFSPDAQKLNFLSPYSVFIPELGIKF